MKWLWRIWAWLTGRPLGKSKSYYIPVTRIAQLPEGARRKAGIRVGIRRAIIKARPPKLAKRRQRDIGKEQLKRIKAKRFPCVIDGILRGEGIGRQNEG